MSIFKEIASNFNIIEHIESMINYCKENEKDQINSWNEAHQYFEEIVGFWIDYFQEEIEIILNFRSYFIKFELNVKDMKNAIIAILYILRENFELEKYDYFDENYNNEERKLEIERIISQKQEKDRKD